MKRCLATALASGVVLLGAAGCGGETETHVDHAPASTAPAATNTVQESAPAPVPTAESTPEVQAPAPEPAPAAEPAPAQQVPQQAPAPKPAPVQQPAPAPQPAPTLTAPGFEPRAGY
ncbi:hypothetical protein [Nocardia sp. bgisy118]|uniref:hypothetical protein n=1 Tax=Nocardia sp. bgisy118 TaxID=3413786 RepID=UPI003F49F9E5